ncbi:MAG TPA: DUF721 domain-containing protein [Acidimicrobiales bacterium]|nr:DUF721 domain-containing protein [Acidimicrobiales bacterium]
MRDRRARSTDGPTPLAESLGVVADRLGMGRADVVGAVFSRWEEIVGPAVAAHVRPLRIEGTTLVVTADHPAWAVQIKHLRTEVLQRVGEVTGGARAPDDIEVRVRR